jgi:hypothetical protein
MHASAAHYVIRDRFTEAEMRSLRALRRRRAKTVARKGAKTSAYRNPAGIVTLRSAGQGDAALTEVN